MGNLVTTRIITGKFGVSCMPACDGLITSHFSLYCVDMLPEVGHGGSIPLPPGAIKDFYKVVDEPYLIPRDREHELFYKGTLVVLELKLGEKVIERTYKVPDKHATMIVNALNLMNTTRERMKVKVDKLTTIASKAAVRIFNIRKVK